MASMTGEARAALPRAAAIPQAIYCCSSAEELASKLASLDDFVDLVQLCELADVEALGRNFDDAFALPASSQLGCATCPAAERAKLVASLEASHKRLSAKRRASVGLSRALTPLPATSGWCSGPGSRDGRAWAYPPPPCQATTRRPWCERNSRSATRSSSSARRTDPTRRTRCVCYARFVACASISRNSIVSGNRATGRFSNF